MSFDTLYMMQVFLIICMIFSMIAYVSLLRSSGFEELQHNLAATGCMIARQYTKKLKIEDYTAFEKYGIWRYSSRFWSI